MAPAGRRAKSSMSRRVTDGASRASPAATTVIACTRSSRRTSLSRKPLAPARSASNTYSSRSKVVRMTTFTGSVTSGPASRRVASMPSTRGMRTSMSTTSARSRRATATASSPSPASPTTVRWGWASTIMENPLRTSSWSSATTTRTGAPSAVMPAAGAGPGTLKPPSGAGPTSSSPPTAATRSRMPIKPCPPPDSSRAAPPDPLRGARAPRPSSATVTTSAPSQKSRSTRARLAGRGAARW